MKTFGKILIGLSIALFLGGFAYQNAMVGLASGGGALLVIGIILYVIGKRKSNDDDYYPSTSSSVETKEEKHYYIHENGQDHELHKCGSGTTERWENDYGEMYKDDGHGNLHKVDNMFDD